ncbi:Uu.00g012880.m01.CDS01 [Anthostomella pinea]|uniref:Uu.00g012880.m01.CDS01 n=1 Tax=Anthostomella pinea TaxID=933095 RepID=A0AAI8VYQ0_9PEZI|nr:Uu.00g012880.m01.CDS01 [Anthostomella pinea]
MPPSTVPGTCLRLDGANESFPLFDGEVHPRNVVLYTLPSNLKPIPSLGDLVLTIHGDLVLTVHGDLVRFVTRLSRRVAVQRSKFWGLYAIERILGQLFGRGPTCRKPPHDIVPERARCGLRLVDQAALQPMSIVHHYRLV